MEPIGNREKDGRPSTWVEILGAENWDPSVSKNLELVKEKGNLSLKIPDSLLARTKVSMEGALFAKCMGSRPYIDYFRGLEKIRWVDNGSIEILAYANG
ncbi:hypothetical protein KI387_026719, partial [Taxus chinensis]